MSGRRHLGLCAEPAGPSTLLRAGRASEARSQGAYLLGGRFLLMGCQNLATAAWGSGLQAVGCRDLQGAVSFCFSFCPQ